MTRASTHTLLSLDRYAKIMGISPMHFAGATANHFWPLRNACSDLWLQHEWQFADAVSREALAAELNLAAIDIARELGWWPAPVWVAQEVHPYPRPYRRDAIRGRGRNVRGQRVGVKTEYAKVISGGRRGVAEVSLGATVTYTDADGDGFAETATVSVATTQTDPYEVKVFNQGHSGGETWEIRPARSKSISAGVFTATFWSWQMIDPHLWEFYPTEDNLNGPTAIDLRGLEETPIVTTGLVNTVDVYREYNDTSQISAVLVWEPSPGGDLLGMDWSCSVSSSDCAACAYTEQDGCLHVQNALIGYVIPTPATYSDGTWTQTGFVKCRDPDSVKLWYRCGDIGNTWLSGNDYDPLSERWARAIAQLATARLERPLCSCGNLVALTTKWQQDAAGASSGINLSQKDLENPFGTRYGEVLAWREVDRERHKIRGGGVV